MGMDLIGAGLSYNWDGWRWLVKQLESWGVDVRELKFSNDGDPVSKETCLAIADAIQANVDSLDEYHRVWLEPHIEAWRQCRGCTQW